MATRDFTKFFLYRWRYAISYVIVGLFLIGVLLFAGLYIPGGLSAEEMRSTVQSASLTFNDLSSFALPNLPYHMLQAGIFKLFGVSIFTIKLPSLILALFSALGLMLLLRRWFKPNIAVIASIIAITTGQFLFVAQHGTPSILYIFWPTLLLLLGTQITRAKHWRFLWKILFGVAAALSLYTPLGIYPLIAISLAVALHPHLRNAVRKLSNTRLSIVTLVFLILVAPLIWFMSDTPGLGLQLLGVPLDTAVDFGANSVTLLQQYFWFWQPSTTIIMTPVFGLGSALLIALGMYRLILTRETTRSYLIILWIICLVPILLLNPSFTTVTFVPSVLLLAAGFTSLIGYWYRLFPLNPYARVAGLIPAVVLVGALVIAGLARYAYGYHYSSTTAPLFSKDLRLLPDGGLELVAEGATADFYLAVAKYRTDLVVTLYPTNDTFVATKDSRRNFDGYRIKTILVDTRSNNADRFYVYERIPATPAQ